METNRTTATQTPAQRAISRALSLRLPAQVFRICDGVYAVPSTSTADVEHTVTVSADGAYGCTCLARRHPACVHRAAAAVWRIEHDTGCRVTGPGTRPASLRGAGGAAVAA